MELASYFTDFLANIRPTPEQRAAMKEEHARLRSRLEDDDGLCEIIVGTFIQGSYRRFTATKSHELSKCDVDIIVVTTLHETDTTPQQALERFRPFLEEHYPKKHRIQGRSWGIEANDIVALDLVPTSAPSEAELQVLESAKSASWDFPEEPEASEAELYSGILLEGFGTLTANMVKAAATPQWKQEPLRIPDREAEVWDDTHPLEQIRWTWEKNKATNDNYVNVVKAIKWWRRVKTPRPKHPRSYPLEHIVGDCCPAGITSIAAGVTLALEAAVATYSVYAQLGVVPVLADRGVPGHNVLGRVSADDFQAFMAHVEAASKIARRAYDSGTVKESAVLWRELFGDDFPAPPDDEGGSEDKGDPNEGEGGFTPRATQTRVREGRFA